MPSSSPKAPSRANRTAAIAACTGLALCVVAFGLFDQGPLSTVAVVHAKVSQFEPEAAPKRTGWEINVGGVTKPLRALARRAERNDEPYPELRSTYVDFDNARCRTEQTVVRAGDLFPGDRVLLECVSGVDLRKLGRSWACVRLCPDS